MPRWAGGFGIANGPMEVCVNVLIVLGILGCKSGNPETGVDSPTDSPAGDSQTESGTQQDTDDPVGTLTDAFTLTGAAPKNVVILSLDTLRWDRMSVAGYTDDAGNATTPTIDTMLADGVLLSEHRSCSSWTFPSFLCALAGMDQTTLGFWPTNISGEDPGKAPDSLPVMAEYFQSAGYHTMLSSNSGFMGQAGNLGQGFDEGEGEFPSESNDFKNAADVVGDAISMLDAHRASNPDQPWMLHAHIIDPHMPYNPPESYLSGLTSLEATTYDLTTEAGTQELWSDYESLSDVAQVLNMAHLRVRYDAESQYTDDQVGRLLGHLGDIDAWEDTLLVFFIDHGEEFWEHQNFNHGYTAYEEVTRIAAGFYQPGNLEPIHWDGLTSHEDLLPSLFTLLGWAPESYFTGWAVGSEPRSHLFHLVYRHERTVQAINTGTDKLIARWDMEADKMGYFSIEDDPFEQVDLYDESNARVQELWGLLCDEIERLAAHEKRATPILPDLCDD